MERTKANKKTLVVRHESWGPSLQVTKWWPVWWITGLGRWSLRDFHLLLVCFETNYCLLHIWCLHLEFRTLGSHRTLLILIPGGCVCADKNEADVEVFCLPWSRSPQPPERPGAEQLWDHLCRGGNRNRCLLCSCVRAGSFWQQTRRLAWGKALLSLPLGNVAVIIVLLMASSILLNSFSLEILVVCMSQDT